MARAITAPALAILTGATHWHWLRVKIENPDGVLTSIQNLESTDWRDAIRITSDVDHPTMSAILTVRLDTDDASMAPLMGGSPINRDSLDAYVPFLQLYREVQVDVAVTALGAEPGDDDWHPLGTFVIDEIRHPSTDTIEIEMRDIGARMLDKWITRTSQFGHEDGATMKATVANILRMGAFATEADDFEADGDAEPDALVFPYELEPTGTLTGARDLALRIGWDFRYRFDDDVFRPRLFEPPRGNEVADWTLHPYQYEKVTRLDISIEHVRNLIEVEYYDRALERRNRVFAFNADSIAKYGERWMEIIEADDSIIDSEEEAQAMADNAANDLSEPWAEIAIEAHLFWPVQEGDVVLVKANDVHFDSDQTFAVVGFTHELAHGHGKTTFLLRGTVTGAWKEWLRGGGESDDGDEDEETPGIVNFREINRSPTEVTFAWDVKGNVDTIYLWLDRFEQPVESDPWPTLDSPGFVELSGDTREYTAEIPPIGFIDYGLIVPFDVSSNAGEAHDFTVQPNDAIPLIEQFRQTAGSSGLFRDLSFYVKEPKGLGGTLRAWVNRSSSSDADPSAAADGTLAIADATTNLVDATDVFDLTGGGTANLCEDIRVHPGKGKRVFFEFINDEGISSGVQSVLLLPGVSPVDEENELIAGIIDSYTPFASDIRPYRILGALPGSGAFEGEIVYLTTDNKLYRWDGSAWTAAVATVDLVGTVNTAQIADDAITADKIGNAAVETAHLANLAVDATKIGNAAVTTAKLANLAVTDAILAAGAVITTKIADDAITSPKIIAGAITTAKIAAGAVTANEIAANTILAGNIAAGQITTAKIAAGAVTANEIAANTIVAGNIAAGTITGAKIAAGTITAGNIAALTITAGEIAANTITSGQIAANTITAGEIAANAITSDELAANSVIAGKVAAAAISTTELAADAVTTAKIAAGQVTAAKISISTLASIATDAGIIVAGKLQNAAGTQYLDLNASGTNGFLVHTRMTLRANGTAEFKGDVIIDDALLTFKTGSTTHGWFDAYAFAGGPPAFDGQGWASTVNKVGGGATAVLSWTYDTTTTPAYAGGVLYADGKIVASGALEIGGNATVTGDLVVDDITADDITCDVLTANVGINTPWGPMSVAAGVEADAGFLALQVPS
jgi:hypothetical protein